MKKRELEIVKSNEISELLQGHWKFLDGDWVVLIPRKYHRSMYKSVREIAHIKDMLFKRLGAIPVFFFLNVLFGDHYYPSPYRNVEKGLLLIYQLVVGLSTNEMDRFIPKSSMQSIIKEFYVTNGRQLDNDLNIFLGTMFSTPELRVASAQLGNPHYFKHITLMVDGHDSRALHNGAYKPELYSYKLKHSGYRTQMCIDINGMILHLSPTEQCRDNPDNKMLQKMKILNKINTADCIALDGGYPLSTLEDMVENYDNFNMSNFCTPFRKPRGLSLSDNEAQFNTRFGSFRSMIESTFGALGSTFERLSNKDVVRVANPKVYNLQMKLCCLLYNVKRMVTECSIPSQQHHTGWMHDRFDYPMTNDEKVIKADRITSINEKAEMADDISKLQYKLLATSLRTVDDVYVEL